MSVRVAFIGNMNNNHFAMVRFLRDRGVDAELLLTNEQEHFPPSADTFDTEYMGYTRQLSWGSSTQFLRTSAGQVRSDLEPFNVLIGCGLAPAYCHKAGRTMDIFCPYGDDIWTETFYRFVSPHLVPSVWQAVYYQRLGIRKSKIFHMSATNDLYEKQHQKYKGQSERWYEGLPMVYSPSYKRDNLSEMISRTHWGHKFSAIRKSTDLMVISHMRHSWKDASDPSAKGNDILLRGWKLFCEQNKNLNARLVLIEYGKDVEKSRNLVLDFDLNDTVFWLPKMCRKDIMVGLFLSDVVCGEFVNSWMSSGILYEALVAGKPILAWRDDDLYTKEYPNLYPILNAKNPEAVASRIKQHVWNTEESGNMGKKGHRWYEEEVAKKAIDKYVTFIETRADELGMTT